MDDVNQMWICTVEIVDGENTYQENSYFFGSLEEASGYISSIASTYFGTEPKETVWEPAEGCYYNRSGTRACHPLLPIGFKEVAAMTSKGALTYVANWSLK